METITNVNMLQTLINNLQDKQIIIIKFTADWCGPCKNIKDICNKHVSQLPKNINFYEIDVDDSIELYSFLKTKKMVNGIPAILAYYNVKEDYYIPDDSILGGNKEKVNEFFLRQIERFN